MASKIYYSPLVLTGGGATALDYIDGDLLADGDIAFVGSQMYKLNGSSSASENSPFVIAPDTNPGTKRWELQAPLVPNQGMLNNLSLTATVGSKALTVALKTAGGNDCTTTDLATIAFRSATLTAGTPVYRTVTGALSVVLSSGSTLGFTAAEAGRLYVWAIDNAGTVELALSRTADIFPEENLVSTTAEGGAGAADSASVMYSTTARSNVACRCIGYIEITTGATAGEWDNAPTKIQVMGPGVKRTGDIVQIRRTVAATVISGAGTFPIDDTIPQISDGSEMLTLAVTPKSAINKIRIDVSLNCGHSQVQSNIIALFEDATANAIYATSYYHPATAHIHPVAFSVTFAAGTTSEKTYRLRMGGQSAANTYLNGASGGGRLYGGVMSSCLEATEIFA